MNLQNNLIKDYSGFVIVSIMTNYSPNLSSLNLMNTGAGLETVKAIRDMLASS